MRRRVCVIIIEVDRLAILALVEVAKRNARRFLRVVLDDSTERFPL